MSFNNNNSASTIHIPQASTLNLPKQPSTNPMNLPYLVNTNLPNANTHPSVNSSFSRTSPSKRTPSPVRTPTPPGFCNLQLNDEPKGITKEEFKELLTNHFKEINLDTAAVIKEAMKPIDNIFDEVEKKLDDLAKPRI